MADLVCANAASRSVQRSPKAAELLAEAARDRQLLEQLQSWQPALILQALYMMTGPGGQQPDVRAYALRSLLACNPQQASLALQ